MEHPVVNAEHDDLPSLRLVLPGQLDRDQNLAGLAGAIGEVRTGLAVRLVVPATRRGLRRERRKIH